ncbi:MAG: FHA domain-containing protein [Verrucomicrobiales bacterium]|nr:FHA domain-containing protein [Verrucomicrobiales bacterium]MCP5525211.1 FHA domain-containing protein [Verrucomicrobiales bacterium]
MNENPPFLAWLEQSGGEPIPVAAHMALGRMAGNQMVLPDERVSRRHALIHSQEQGEYWLVDLGSRNGTYVNDRRVNQPARLQNGDLIRIGPFHFKFRQPADDATRRESEPTTAHTLVDFRTERCWLLVADVEGSTRLGQDLAPDELAMLIGQWFLHCQQVVDQAGGTINKYLGDGFLAYWPASEDSQPEIAGLVESLRRLQQRQHPPFRFVLHLGEVFLGGGPSLGEENLSGATVNFAFRMEKLAGSLKERCLLSEAACERLAGTLSPRPVGRHALPGFQGDFPFFGL